MSFQLIFRISIAYYISQKIHLENNIKNLKKN